MDKAHHADGATPLPRVLVDSSDVIVRAGVAAMLQPSQQISVAASDRSGGDASAHALDVIVLAERRIGAVELHRLRRMRQKLDGTPSCVLITDLFPERDTLLAIRCGVMSILPALRLTAEQLVTTVLGATQGRSRLPHGLQAALLRQLNEVRESVLEPHDLTLSNLTARERNVLRLVAEGLRTDEIAERMRCSQGTVKGTLLAVMRRLGFNNRAEAVAYAIRSGAVN